jgi:uncharacterized protein YutE (UPF0331/DUF86 family)
MSPSRVSRAVVADKIALVRRMLDAIRTLPLEELERFSIDPRMAAAGESYLRRALEGLLDLARHVLAKGFGRAPAEYAVVARELGEVGVTTADVATRLVSMARYRNRMVHFYDEVTERELFELLTTRLDDFEKVIGDVTQWMAKHPDRVSEPSSPAQPEVGAE